LLFQGVFGGDEDFKFGQLSVVSGFSGVNGRSGGVVGVGGGIAWMGGHIEGVAAGHEEKIVCIHEKDEMAPGAAPTVGWDRDGVGGKLTLHASKGLHIGFADDGGKGWVGEIFHGLVGARIVAILTFRKEFRTRTYRQYVRTQGTLTHTYHT